MEMPENKLSDMTSDRFLEASRPIFIKTGIKMKA
ncbi:hypothetical protein BC643_1494 [Mangrovibacterium diazotrophicum]|uniref:Uncharacterized protein n=1 Tax=Mangrovibacterium diazotrophicum TaxID=1261403 RepID=A0A419W6R9_9BACT|nr:hypothetical protein BC643_1494 [Mangrovibacterium diazotrophicum]